MNTMNRFRELKEKQKRQGVTEDEDQFVLEIVFSMLEKQIRMLIKLAERSPVVKGKLTEEIVKTLEPGAEYALVERQQMNVLLELLERFAGVVKNGLSGEKDFQDAYTALQGDDLKKRKAFEIKTRYNIVELSR